MEKETSYSPRGVYYGLLGIAKNAQHFQGGPRSAFENKKPWAWSEAVVALFVTRRRNCNTGESSREAEETSQNCQWQCFPLRSFDVLSTPTIPGSSKHDKYEANEDREA